jgi:hypothetical protein
MEEIRGRFLRAMYSIGSSGLDMRRFLPPLGPGNSNILLMDMMVEVEEFDSRKKD